MKTLSMASFALAAAVLLSTAQTLAQQAGGAQPPSVPSQSQAAQNRTQAGQNQTMTLNGCVGGTGTIDQPFVLSKITVVGPPGAGAQGTPQPGTPSATNPPPVAPTGVAGTGAPVFAATDAYRLTGRDLSMYLGRRVQVVGTATPTAAASSNAGMGAGAKIGTGDTGTSGSTEQLGARGAMSQGGSLPQFRVQSVRALPGSCK